MRNFLVAVGLFWTLSAFSILQVGDPVPNLCWKDQSSANFCLDDAKNTVRVLNYGTGWCPDCNVEMAALAPKSKKYSGKPVIFLSLSAASFESGGEPTPEFLKAWKQKHSIPFPVLASPKDPGRLFFDPPFSIPNFVIVDQAGKLAFKSAEVGIDEIFKEIDQLL